MGIHITLAFLLSAADAIVVLYGLVGMPSVTIITTLCVSGLEYASSLVICSIAMAVNVLPPKLFFAITLRTAKSLSCVHELNTGSIPQFLTGSAFFARNSSNA